MDNIEIYNDSAIILERKAPNKVICWYSILIIFLILIISISFLPFNIYKSYYGIIKIESDNSFIIFDLEYINFPINKYDKLYIKDKLYDYEIVDINENNLIIKVDLDDSIRVNNNITQVSILTERTTILNIVKNKIKKGFGL
jgi:hypothetical protein